MLANARRDRGDLASRIGSRVDHHVAERVRQRDEIALGIDHHLLHRTGASFQQPAQQMRLARAGIALHQQARGEQLRQIEGDAAVRRPFPDRRSHS